MNRIQSIWMSLIVLAGTGFRPAPAGPVELSQVNATVRFGISIDFSARLKTSAPVSVVFLYVEPQGRETRIVPVIPTPEGELSYRMDLRADPLPPETPLKYWYNVFLSDNRDSISKAYDLFYHDDHFAWQMKEDPAMRLFWVGREDPSADAAFRSGLVALKYVHDILPAPTPDRLDIFLLSSTVEMDQVLSVYPAQFTSGKMLPKWSSIFLAVPVGGTEKTEFDRQIPRTIVELYLRQMTGDNFHRLPAWLVEGLRTQAELSPDPALQTILRKAANTNKLLPMRGLCAGLFDDGQNLPLARAQSVEFLRFVLQNAGAAGPDGLISGYKDGADCVSGVEQATGKKFVEFEYSWKTAYLGASPTSVVLGGLEPFILTGLFAAFPLLAIAGPGLFTRIFSRRKIRDAG